MVFGRRWRFLVFGLVWISCWQCVSAREFETNAKTLFPVQEFTLTNGLRVLTLEDHNCPIVAVQVWYHVGSANEPPGQRGFAHLFEHMMFRGTDRLGPTDHMDLIKSVGGNGNAFTDFDETCYHETLPAHQLELALWLESERMAFLTVDNAGFATERKVVEEERRLGLNQPYGDLPDIGLPIVFGQHPYAHSPIGTIRDLRRATPTNVHEWWTRWYVPNNATLVIVGDVNSSEVEALTRHYFGWMPRVGEAERNIPKLGPFDSAQQITLKLENAPAPAVGLVWRTVGEGEPDSFSLELLATILGGGESSRLYRRLVAEDHLAVTAMAAQQGMSQAGGFGMGAVISPFGGDTDRALNALRTELDRVLKEGVTEPELNKARNQMINRLVSGTDTMEGKALLIGRAAVVGTGIEELNQRLDRLRRISREDLNRAALKYLDPEHALTVTVPGAGLLGNLSRLIFGVKKSEEDIVPAKAPETVLRGRPGVSRPADMAEKAPIREGNPPIPNPAVEEHRLANGLRTLIVPRIASPEVHMVLVLPRGAWAETKPGAASMTLKMLSKATEARDNKTLTEELERNAIEMSGGADQDDSRIIVSCLTDHAEQAFSLLAEVIEHPAFPEEPLKTLISQTVTELTVADSDPGSVANRELDRHIFAGHPYARRPSGEVAEVSALRRQDLVAFWRQAGRPDTATLVVTGGLPAGKALELAEKSLGQWKPAAAGAPELPEPKPVTKSGPTRILLVDWPQAEQSEIRIGSPGLAYRDPAKAVGNLVSSYFGGSFGSRLMKATRIEKGATYGASGGFRSKRFGGIFDVSTFTRTASTADTLRLALNEINNLRAKGPTPEELALHRRYFLGSAAEHFETPNEVATIFARIAANGMPLDHAQRNFETIGRADAQDCEALVRRLVHPDQLVIVVVGDAARIANDLRTIAPVTVLDRSGSPKTKIESPKGSVE